MRVPERVLDLDLPQGPSGIRARALIDGLRDALTELDGAGVSATIQVPAGASVEATDIAPNLVVVSLRDMRTFSPEVSVKAGRIELSARESWDEGEYHVVIVRRFRTASEEECVPSDEMREILVGEGAGIRVIGEESARIRRALEAQAIDATDVCLAFSFRVRTIRDGVKRLHDYVVARAERLPPSYVVSSAVDPGSVRGLENATHVGQVIYGTYASPRLRGGDGRFDDGRIDGSKEAPTEDIRFGLSLPKPKEGRPAPFPIVMGLHGLGGDIDSTLPYYAEYLAEEGFAYLTIDGVAHGSRREDLVPQLSLFDLDDLRRGRDRLRQTLVDLLQLRLLVASGLSVDGQGDTVERTRVRWSGGSYGGIFGTMLLAFDDGLEAAHVDSCGGPWREVLLHSAVAPGLVRLLIAGELDLPPEHPLVDRMFELFAELGQWIMDPGDVTAFAPFVRRRPLLGTEPRGLLMQYWVGETLMPNSASEFLAHTLGVAVNGAVENDGGAQAVWSYDVAALGLEPGTDAHGSFWKIERARRQAIDFLATHGARIRSPNVSE